MFKEKRIEALAKLGDYLRSNPSDLHRISYMAEQNNLWFSLRFITYAIGAVIEKYLDKNSLLRWMEKYNSRRQPPQQTVGLVTAGNIPLVGFHDILCVLLSGNKVMVKPSERDLHLLPFILQKWAEIDPEMEESLVLADKLHDFSAVIATGSDNSSRYFDFYFRNVPHIIRKNRNGIAVLHGNESDQELSLLGDDIFLYYGLGCRNVSKIYVPKDYDFDRFLQAIKNYEDVILHSKYKNNYDYNYAVCVINKIPLLTNDFILLVQESVIPSRVGMVHYEYYDNLSGLSSDIKSEMLKIQCIVSNQPVGDLSTIPIGTTQKPELDEYADGIDTMDFILGLNVTS